MNVHIPQGVQASAEVAILMRASAKLVTPQSNGPVAGIVQDGLVASYLATNTWSEGPVETLVKKSVFMDCVTGADISIQRYHNLIKRAQKWYPEFISEDLKVEDEIPGKLMFSIVFPPNLCYSRMTHTSTEFPKVKIRGGVLLPDSGPVCKQIIGAKRGSLIQHLWKEYSPETTIQFLTEVQFLTDQWLPHHGFSIGISDCISISNDDVVRAIAETQIRIQRLMKTQTSENLEPKINGLLNEMGNIGPKIAQKSMNKGEKNALNVMRLSGAKGNIANLSAIVAFVGQQNINGQRVPLTLTGGKRALSRFEPGDQSPEARGMVYSNYIHGLNPGETFFHAMAGREGVIATAIRTAETGYAQKKLARKLEDLMVYYDGTVRNSNNRIIQFLYGDDGMDPQKLYNCPGVPFPFFINPQSIATRMNMDVELTRDISSKPRRLKEEEINLLLRYIKIGSPGFQSEVTETATKSLCSALQKALRVVKIYECKIPDFCGEISDLLETSKSQHGDMVGLLAAASNGEPTTQLMLNVFHGTGQKGADVSLGVPRLKEILNATKSPKTPSCTIYFDDENLKKGAKAIQNSEKRLLQKKKRKDQQVFEKLIQQNRRKCERIINSKLRDFEETHLDSLIQDYELQYIKRDVDPKTDASPTHIIPYKEYTLPWWGSLTIKIHDQEFDPSFWVLILRLNVTELCYKGFTVEDIAELISQESEENLSCIASPNNMGIIHVTANFMEIREFLNSKGYMKSTKMLNSEGLPKRLSNTNLEFFLCRDSIVPFVRSLKLSGVENIKRAIAHEDPESHEWMIKTRGSNFKTILAMPGIDATRSVTNNIWEIYRTLGVEAVRKFLIEEVTRILSFGGTYVNPRHIQLLIDSMTDVGDITNVNRNGISRSEGPIKKIMFEQSVDNTVEAAAFVEEDRLQSISSAIMCGKIARCGTGTAQYQFKDRRVRRPPKRRGR